MLKIYVFIRTVANWFDYHIGLHFSLSSKGQAAAVSTDALNARVRYLPQSYFGKYSSVPFFKSVSMARSFLFFFFFSTVSALPDLKICQGRMEFTACSRRFPLVRLLSLSGCLADYLPLHEVASLRDLLILQLPLGVTGCCFSNNKAYSLDFYYSWSTFPFLKESCTLQIIWPVVGRRL